MAIQEQIRENQKLESIVQSSKEKLLYVQNERSGQQAEQQALQLELDEQHRQLKELEESKKGAEEFSQIELEQQKQSYNQMQQLKQDKIHQLKENIASMKEQINQK